MMFNNNSVDFNINNNILLLWIVVITDYPHMYHWFIIDYLFNVNKEYYYEHFIEKYSILGVLSIKIINAIMIIKKMLLISIIIKMHCQYTFNGSNNSSYFNT